MLTNGILLVVALALVAINGFFVAAEFALVKVRMGRIDELIKQGRPFATTARWLAERLDASLSACQLGITMASLALGWVGEPAFAYLLEPLLSFIGLESERIIHGISFIIAFSAITALHLVVGEQAPKIFAIRRPELMCLWCAPLLKLSYFAFYPFLVALNHSTAILLRMVGMRGQAGHEEPPTEDELRVLLKQAHAHGHLTRSEHRLINAVFEFDDMICRRVMVPRSEIAYFDLSQSLSECLALAKRTMHTRYPLCDGSLDDLIGVVHLKDLVGIAPDTQFDLRSIARPPRKVPESMPISRVLKHFQATHQLLAFVLDEYGTMIGIVTLENVLERIVGPVEDEFDFEQPDITPAGPDEFIVLGITQVKKVERELGIEFGDPDVDTVAGVWTAKRQKLPEVGDVVTFDGGRAEVVEGRDDRIVQLRFYLTRDKSAAKSQ